MELRSLREDLADYQELKQNLTLAQVSVHYLLFSALHLPLSKKKNPTFSHHFTCISMLSDQICLYVLVLRKCLGVSGSRSCVCAVQTEADEMRRQVEDEAAQRELCEFQLEKLRMQVLGMRTSA